jgi:hypothetical protein
MKPILTIFTFIFTIMFSFISFAEWTEVSRGESGRIYYVDFDRIRKIDGYIYWWELADYINPSEYGDLSARAYVQGDCKMFRTKHLSVYFHREPMGRGKSKVVTPKPKWLFPPPDSNMESILKQVCNW